MKKINKPVLLFLDNMRRDYLVADIFRAYLEKKNFKVFLINNENYELAIKFIPAKLFIFIKNYFQPLSPKILKLIKKNDLDLLIIDAEGAQTLERCKFWAEKGKNDIISHTQSAKKIFLWNDSFLNFISEYSNTNKDKFIVSGSPKVSASLLAEKFLKNKNKINSIGLIGRFGHINDFASRSSIASTIHHFWNFDEFPNTATGETLTFYYYLKIIDYLIKNTNYIINIRPHPNEKLESYNELIKLFGNRIVISKFDQDFIEWMHENDKIICTPSTSIVEPIINNIPLISVHKLVNGVTLREYVEKMIDPFLSVVNSPETFDDLKKLINTKDLKNLESTKEFEEGKKKSYGDQKNSMKLEAMMEITKYIKNNYYSDKKKTFLFSSLIYFALNFPTFIKFKIFKKLSYLHSPFFNYFLIKKKKLSSLIAKELE